jgi:putative addiction module killer protein
VEIESIRILYYLTSAGQSPYLEWFDRLEKQIQFVVLERLTRVERGLLGDAQWIGQGVWELRFHLSSGYRIYFGRDGQFLVILLCGGNKQSQQRDIEKARAYWTNYLRRK